MHLTNENTWWNEGGLWQDPDLRMVTQSPLNYRPEIFKSQELRPGSLFTLRGPRRSGKTVTLKLLIADLMEKRGVEGRKILWLSLDTVRTLSQMEDLLLKSLSKHPTRFLFVDEITSVVGWQKVIKKLKDQGTLSDLSTVLTGSSAHDLKKGSERMAGRKGSAVQSDRVLLPMSYQEFLKQVPFNSGKNIESYLKVGGFPFRVSDFVTTPKSFDPLQRMEIFDDVFFYEIHRRKLDRNIALELMARLSDIKSHAVSYEAITKPLSIAKDTVKKYLNALGDAFLLATIYAYDTSRNRVAIKKDKKFVWIDPALSYLAKHMHQGVDSDEATRAEWAVGVELLRRYEARLWEGVSAPRNVFTWKSSGGNEIDYLVVDRSLKRLLPFEMKYQSQIADWDFQVMERAFKSGFLITKDVDKIRAKSKGISLHRFLAGND